MQFLRSPAAALDRIVHARASLLALFGFAYLEAAFLPVPIEAVTAPYMQMRRDMLWLIAAVALGGYVAAALTGYGIGALFYDELGGPLVASFGWQARAAEAEGFIGRYGFWAMIALALTPLPTQLGTMVAGALGLALPSFLFAVVLARGARTLAAALLVLFFGDKVVRWVVRRHHRRHPRPDRAPHPPR